jgi:hypothetical protein
VSEMVRTRGGAARLAGRGWKCRGGRLGSVPVVAMAWGGRAMAEIIARGTVKAASITVLEFAQCH